MPISTDFTEFLRHNLPALLKYGTALAGNPHDAADLVQAACEKVSRKWSRIAGSPTQLAYVKATMANTRISQWRRHRAEWLLDAVPESGVSDRYPADSAALWTAVRDLPRRQRAVVVLRYVEGHSEAEIAQMLGISAGTVKSQASKALATLRRTTAETFVGGIR